MANIQTADHDEAAARGPATTPTATTIVGKPTNSFWIFNPATGYDLTHPPSPDEPLVKPRIQLQTATTPITIAPAKTALVIIDMQNLFLSPAMGAKRGQGHDAEDKLLSLAIPAARKANIQIIHLTWGISDEELAVLPPLLFHAFGYGESTSDNQATPPPKEIKRPYGIGDNPDPVALPDGSTTPAGRLLMRGQWNTALHAPLQTSFDQSQTTAALPDVRFHKCRISGFWSADSDIQRYLREGGITTLLFGGVNTDQCVLASVQDASNLGYDTILLRDACGTSSPDFAWRMVEYNCRRSWGFAADCRALVEGVEGMDV